MKVEHNGRSLFLNKKRVEWLFQDCERVSCECLFRARSKKPFPSESPKHALPEGTNNTNDQIVCSSLKVGNASIFKVSPTELKISVIQFSNNLST